MFCPGWEHPAFFIFSQDPKIPTLLYYSHIPTAVIALLGSLLIFLKNPRVLVSQILLGVAVSFSMWGFLDLILWAQDNIHIITFTWSFMLAVEAAFFFFSLYFVYVFMDGKDMPFWMKVLMSVLFLPFIILLPTSYGVEAFRLPDCDAIDGRFMNSYMLYFTEPLIILWIMGALIRRYRRTASRDKRQQALFLLAGVGAFLATFWVSRVAAKSFGDYAFEQFGFFGIVVLMGVLMYLIIRYQLFNIRIFAAQALVGTLLILVASQFFLLKDTASRMVVFVTFVIAAFFGAFLIRVTKAEAERKEKLEKLTAELKAANERLVELDKMKSQVFSFASHQLRTPITAVRGFSYLLYDEYDRLPPQKVKEMLGKIKAAGDRTVAIINDFLMLRRLEEGKMEYAYAETDMVKLVRELVEEVRLMAEGKGLELTLEAPADPVMVMMDGQKFLQVIQNLVDNAIKYTVSGWVRVSIELLDGRVRVVVRDSGRGISAEFLPKLFHEFNRDKSVMESIQGTGIGLFIAQQIINEGHKGKIWVESEGPGKGSSFFVEIPTRIWQEGETAKS